MQRTALRAAADAERYMDLEKTGEWLYTRKTAEESAGWMSCLQSVELEDERLQP